MNDQKSIQWKQADKCTYELFEETLENLQSTFSIILSWIEKHFQGIKHWTKSSEWRDQEGPYKLLSVTITINMVNYELD